MSARFWVGGTGNWDSSDTTHWSASSGGAGGASVPGASDTVTFDASSGGGTVTVSVDISVTSITGGAFTGTLDFGATNPTMQTFNFSGTGTRTLNMGSGTWTITGTGTVWNVGTTTNLSISSSSANVVISDTSSSSKTISYGTGGLTFYSLTITSGGTGAIIFGTTAKTFNTLNCTGGSKTLTFGASTTFTISNWNVNGTYGNPVTINSSTPGTRYTIALPASISPEQSDYISITDCALTGNTALARNSTNGGNNVGWIFRSNYPIPKCVDSYSASLYLPLKSWYYNGSNVAVTNNIGTPKGTVTLGDGTTTTTFPTQLSPKGMSFDGTTDYLKYLGTLSNGTYSIVALMKPITTVSKYIIDCRASGGTGYVWFDGSGLLAGSTGTSYVNGVASNVIPKGIMTLGVSGITLASTDVRIMASNTLGDLTDGNLLVLAIFSGTLTPQQMSILHRKLLKDINV